MNKPVERFLSRKKRISIQNILYRYEDECIRPSGEPIRMFKEWFEEFYRDNDDMLIFYDNKLQKLRDEQRKI